MPTPLWDRAKYDREKQANTILGEIESVSGDSLDRYVTANGMDLIEKMQECHCKGITEAQLEFIRGIRDRLTDKGAL